MPDQSAAGETGLEVVSPGGARRFVRVEESPFLIGRGGETGKHLQLADPRISRQCAAIHAENGRYYLEDRGQRHGIFVNGEKVSRRALEDGDVIGFGIEDFYKLIFRCSNLDTSLPDILQRIENITGSDASPVGLRKLNLLLEATTLLHSRLPLNSVLGTMLDHAVAVTDADRGLLLEANSSGSLRVRLARSAGGRHLSPEKLAPSQTALRLALEQRSSVITEDVAQADADLQLAQSIVAQRLRSIVVVPLYTMPRASSHDSTVHGRRGDFLGVVYLDSRRPAAFSKLDRRILDALAVEAASILDNARLVERERERQRLEQQIGIARDIQQALLPRGFQNFSHLAVTGINQPCLTVGGDYFDVFPLSDERTAFLIADVSGKGLGAALLTTMLQGALSGMTMGADPAQVFNHINRFLCEHADVERYATMFFGILDCNGNLEFINAGHPSPFLLRRGEVTEPFSDGSAPVGLLPGAEYLTARLKLRPDDTLILFSDGVSEAMDPEEQMFGVPRLREVIADQHEAPLGELQKRILDAVERFARGAAQADDVTLLLVRYRGAASS
ncbi:MAG TPA: SpoIIE family protein phosphatase [Candidatus Acidoferrales bacterium]|nr:SpoIIE family protein phosphatase [Candidatus Acidoferrales bacterium]